jgi:hypothetical protein
LLEASEDVDARVPNLDLRPVGVAGIEPNLGTAPRSEREDGACRAGQLRHRAQRLHAYGLGQVAVEAAAVDATDVEEVEA